MTHSMKAVLAILTLGLAGAQAQTAPQTTNVTLPGTVPASVTRTQADAMKAFFAAGGQVQLLNAAGAVIGTLNPDGTVALVGGATLADARTVRVQPAAGQGQATTYTLARDLSKPGAIKFQVPGPNGRMLSLPLSAIVNRQAAMPQAGAQQPTRPEKEDKAQKPEKPAKPENPGKGNNK